MDNSTSLQLESLMEQGKWDEVKKFLVEYLKTGLPEEERGAFYVNFAQLYLKVANNIIRQYDEALNEAISILKSDQPSKERLIDKIKLSNLRKKFQSI